MDDKYSLSQVELRQQDYFLGFLFHNGIIRLKSFNLIINLKGKEDAVMKKATIKVMKPAIDKNNVQCCTCGIIS